MLDICSNDGEMIVFVVRIIFLLYVIFFCGELNDVVNCFVSFKFQFKIIKVVYFNFKCFFEIFSRLFGVFINSFSFEEDVSDGLLGC